MHFFVFANQGSITKMIFTVFQKAAQFLNQEVFIEEN